MSGPWEQYGPAPGPWSKYGTAPAPDLSLQVSPGGATSIPTQVEAMQVAGAPSPAMPAASAVGGGINATMADALKVIPMAAGGLADRLGLPSAAQDVPFSMVKALSDYADQEQAAAQAESKPGAIAGNVLGILPQLAGGEAALGARGESALVENAPRIAKIIEGMKHGLPLGTLLGTEAANTNATNVINHGGDVPTAEKLFGTSLVANTAANVLPMGAFGNPLARALAGGAVNAAGGTGAQALEHMTAPDYVPAPTPASAAQQGGIGALLAMVLGHGGARPDMTAPGTEPAAAAAEPAQAGPAPQLPPGADYTGDFTVGNPRPVVPESPGPVAVTPAGEAFTPPQGLQTMADALAAAPKGKPALPPPTVAVDKAGTAMTTADQHTLATTEPPPQVASMLQALGLTPDVVRAQMAHPGLPRDNTQLNQALDMQSLLHPPALDNHPNAPGNNPTAPMPADNAPTAPKRAQVDTGRVDSRGRPIKVPALDYGRGDTLLHWLAANGGIDAAEMQRQTGLDPAATKDPAVMNPLGKVGMPALRRQGGMSTEQAFERMAQDGWFPGIDPNTPPAVGAQEAADMIHEALNGQQVFHPTEGHDQRIAAQFEEQMQQHQADQANMEGEARAEAAQALKARGIPPADHAEALTLSQLVSRAYDAGADPTHILDATFDGTPAQQARRLWDITHQLEQAHGTDTRTSPRRGQAGAEAPAAGQAAARAGAADAASNASGARAPAVVREPADLFADPTPAEKLKAEQGRRDSARNGLGRDLVKPEQGAGELLAGKKPEQMRVEQNSDATKTSSQLESSIIADHPGTQLDLSEKGKDLTVSKIIVDDKNQGTGTAIMKRITDYADARGMRVLVTPSSDFGGSKSRLKKFYGRHGFVKNKGASRDFTTKESMIRPSKASIPAKVEQPTVTDQTDTPAFRKWFGDSKVVDAQGDPLVVYHGTNGRFDQFNTPAYFSESRQVASNSAEAVSERSGAASVIPVYLSIKNPKLMSTDEIEELGYLPDEVKKLKDAGYDGAINPSRSEIVAFSPNQIKSATGNNGNFDAANPSIVKDSAQNAHYESRSSIAANNGSGESSASLEAQSRLADEKAQGRTRALIHRDGSVEQMHGVDAVDLHARAGQVIVQHGIGASKWTILSHGEDVSPTVANGIVNRASGQLDALHREATPGIVRASSRDMFTKTRGDAGASNGNDNAGNGRPNADTGSEAAGRGKQGELPMRSDASASLTRRAQHSIDEIVRGAGGSVLADSIARDFQETNTAQLIGKIAKTTEDFAAIGQVYRNPHFEVLHYVFTDDAGLVLGESAVTCRMPSASAAFPDGEGIDWLNQQISKYGATKFHMLHNHPSGNPSPSKADIRLTKYVDENVRGAELVGHVVTNHKTYSEITPYGAVVEGSIPTSGEDPFVEHRGLGIHGMTIGSPQDLADIGKAIADVTPKHSIAVIVTDSRNRVTTITSFPENFFYTPGHEDVLRTVAGESRGFRAFAVVPGAEGDMAGKSALRAMMKGLLSDAIVSANGSPISLAANRGRAGGDIGEDPIQENKGVQVHEGADQYNTPATEHDDSIPHRNPGESQADYARRLAGQSRADIKQALTIAKAQRDVSRLGLRAQWAKQDRQLAQADAAFKQYRVMFDKEDKVINLATIHQWETGQRITDADAREFFSLMKSAFDERTAKIQALAPDAMQQLIDHYMPHIWEDSTKAVKWYQSISAKRPLQGDRSFLKQRTHATIKDGMASGLKPVSTNPVDLAILKLGQMDKFIAFHEFRQDLQRRGWVKRMEAGQRVPVGYARIDDPAFQIAGGLQGYHAVPELIAKDINNYLSPSLYRFGAWKALRTVENCLMSGRLGLSMFHGGFTTMDNIVMHADVAGRRMLQGDMTGGLAALLKAPASIVWSPYEGGKLNKQWLGLKPTDGHTAAILDMLEQGGARMKMSPTDYNNAIPKLVKAYRQKEIGGTLRQTLPALGEAISWHIHHKLVPAQKMAARVMLAKFELDRVAGALGKARGDYSGIINAMHPDALKQISAHVVNLVDDRLGQMNYDNQFWNKTARESAQAIIGAVGWQVGTLRTVTGGVRDLSHLWKPEKLLSSLDKEGKVQGDMGRVSGRLTYLLSLGLLMGSLSAITQYLMTGEGPDEIKDYFFPKTGNKNADGSPERLQWPSYWSDHYKLATHPLTTAMHKINPLFSMVMEAIANQDYYGVEVRNEDDPWWKQAGEVGSHMAKGFVPYSVTGADKLQGDGIGKGRQVANFVGITRAPASVSRTAFQDFVAQKAYDSIPKGSRTQAEADHSAAMHRAEDQVRRGKEPDMTGLTDADRRNVDKASRMEVPAIRFKRLGLEDKLRAYDMATPKERKQYDLAAIILRSNWHKTVAGLPADEQDAVLSKIQALTP